MSGAKTLPDERVPLWLGLCWRAWSIVTWPATVRQLRREGFRRTGWMTWETGPAEHSACGKSALGFMVHGPGCACPESEP